MEEKKSLARSLISLLEEAAQAALAAQRDKESEASQHKGAMASRYDTFKEEAQYGAATHARRRSEIDSALQALRRFLGDSRCTGVSERVQLGALVSVADVTTGNTIRYFLVPGGGGFRLQSKGGETISLNITASLAQAMLLKEEGDEVEFGDFVAVIDKVE